MNKKIAVWGREFELKVVFDVYTGEDVLNEQKEAMDAFLSVSDTLLSDDKEIKQYCVDNNKNEVGDSIENIFRYVIPTTLLIKRNTEKHVVALLCNYRFDEEHGLALVYENEKLVLIGSQDEV